MNYSKKVKIGLSINKWVSAKMILCSLVLIVLFSGGLYAQTMKSTTPSDKKEDGIHLIEDKWDIALKQAVKEKKLIFVDAYATWCVPCKQLRATTFKDPKVAAFFNENFVNASVDVEKGAGPKLATQWKIQGLPTLIILDTKGKIIAQSLGFIDAEHLLALGKEALAKKK